MSTRKSSKMVSLILISSALASCSKPQQEEKQKVYMRADSTAPYTEVTQEYSRNNGMGMGTALLWYMAFRPMMGGNGYMSNGIATKSNVGTNQAKNNAMKAQTARGGFGSSAKPSASS